MIFQRTLKLAYGYPDKVNPWLVVMALSVLIHLVAYYALGVKWSKPRITITPIELTFEKLITPKTTPAKQDKPESDVSANLNRNHEQQAAHKQTKKAPMSSQSNSKKKEMISGGVLYEGESRQKKSPTGNALNLNKPEPIDVNKNIKEYAREKSDNGILREKRHDELWFKSQSIMYGKPRNFFDKQDKRAMLIEPDESKKKTYFPKKKKNTDFGIKLGKYCFLGFKDMDKIKQGDPRLSGTPFSCDF